METDLEKLLQDESEDAILARIQEESLRYYNEVELPRRAADEIHQQEVVSLDAEKSTHSQPQPHCSKLNNNSQNTPVEDVFYKESGQGANGFHLAAGETYVYPTNYPIRKYQMNIIQSALFHNTLVSLPTGLGKTFIAAVVMFNYYRWFPQGKIVFMAPTRPLVAQQIRACHNIMAIPIKDTVEMTGTMNPADRLQQWKNKRVFFLTPQVMANDLRSGVCPATHFKCVVIDEAHRATKEYSYCHVIKELEKAGAMFRILALSATPGSNIKAVVEVAQNLRISTLELRGEDSPDVIPYTHSKLIEPVSLSLSKNILDFREQFLLIFERYARNLREARLVTCNVQNMTKFQLLKASERIRSKPPNGMTKARLGVLMSDFTVCMTLAHGLELLQTYGLRAFYQYFTGCEDEEKRKAAFTRLRQDVEFHQLMENLHNAISSPMDQFWSHPKHEHLVKILKEHFSRIENQENGSKVIIFCQYRVVVSEVYELLQKIHPSIKPVMFIGQGGGKDKSGLPQKKQIEIMRNFREGRSNVLIATCVAEEGLDIGSVDLLILMEVQRSPVRLVQRLGRTGRHRQGRCVVLLTNGKEVQKFHEAMATKNSFINMIQNSKLLSANLYKDEPIMVPPHLMPKIQLVHINVPERITPGKAKKQVDIRQALMTKLDETEAVTQSPFLLPEQEALVKEELNTLKVKFNSLSFMESKYIYPRINDAAMECEELFDPQFHQQCEFTDWNRVAQQTYLVSHSLDTEMLCHLLNKAESMQLGQHTDLNSQMDYNTIIGNKKKDQKIKVKPAVQNPIKKRKIEKEENHGMDIRECMAIAAEKVRLTQDKCGNKDDSVIISEPLTSPIILVSTCEPVIQNERERDQVDCPLCNHPFGGIASQLHKLKTSTKEFTFNFDFSKLKFYVNSLTKEAMTQFNGSYTLDKNIGFTVEGINKNIMALKETKQQSSNLFNANDIFDNEFQTPPRPLLPKENSRNQCLKKLDTLNGMVEKVSVKTSPNCQKPDYFDLEDIFAGDDELDIQYLEKYSKTSTPIKNKAPDFDMPLKFCENDTIKRYTQNHNKVENIKFNSCASPNRSANQAGSSSDPLFKIPQIKLNPQMLNTLHDISKGSDVQLSPQSPILSGQIMPHKNYLGPNSPQSPILSGQLTLSSTKKKGIKTLYCESPDSPILSSQFFHINVSSANKLEPKILFSENKIKEQNSNITNSCWVQSLDNGLNKNHANIPQMEIEDDNMVLASQLFDDDSNEGNPKKNLDQSSMYTISQMVEKVNALSKNAMDHDSTILQSEKGTKISEEDCVKFGSSDEDSLFENINLDDFSVRKENNTIHINVSGSGKVLSDNTTNSADCKVVLQKHPLRRRSNETIQRNPHSEAAEDETIQLDDSKCKTSSIISTNKNLAPTNLGTLNKTCEESLITSRWLSCMKSPFQPHSIKTSTPLVSVKNTTNLDSGSDSNNDVFQSPLQKQKTKSPVNVGKPPRKEIKQQLFVEMEANVTGCYSSDEESTSGLDDLDESFINDMTEHPCTSADQTVLDMHARYLQSVKSPVRKPGGFKIPKVSDSALVQDVFSQYVEEDEEDLYLNDSFCCDATEFPVEEEPSILEIAERILNEDRKTRKVKRKRKKLIRPISSNDDTDIDEEHKARRLLSSESSDEDKVGQMCKTVKRKQCFSSNSSSDEQLLKIKQPFKRKRTHLLTSDSDSDRTL